MGLSAYKVIFTALLLVGEGLFLLRLERRENFPLRLAASAAVLLAVSAAFPVLIYNAWYVSFLFLALFACSLAALRFCFAEPFENLLFCAIAGYTAQHLAYLLFTFLNDVTRLGEAFGNFIEPYAHGPTTHSSMAWLQVIFYVDCYFLVYAAVFVCFDRKLRANHSLRLGRTNMVLLSGLLIAADVIFNMITNYYTTGARASLLLERGYNILLCLLILALLYSQLSQRELKDELAGVRYILDQGKKQYELAKKNLDLINMKYHDLRHQSELLASRGELAQEEREELDRVLDGYAAQARTGNEVLDVILTEKTMLCQSRDIQLMCVAEGQGLGFIKAHHLYALLGNALDNAMEAVQDLPRERRAVSLFVKRQGALAHIHVENPCDRPLVLRDGLPATTKGDRDFHGFGMLSMRTVAERYGGGLTVRQEGGIFSLDAVLVDEGMGG